MSKTQEFTPSNLIKVIRLDNFGPADRAVVATQDIEKGTVIEKCPVIRIPSIEVYNEKMWPNPTISHYCFNWHMGFTAIALGFGSLYNHADKPNADYKIEKEDCLVIFAKAKIKAGEEICIDYKYPENSKFNQKNWQ